MRSSIGRRTRGGPEVHCDGSLTDHVRVTLALNRGRPRVAALSGSQTKAPGSAGGYLLSDNLSNRQAWILVEEGAFIALAIADLFSSPLVLSAIAHCWDRQRCQQIAA